MVGDISTSYIADKKENLIASLVIEDVIDLDKVVSVAAKAPETLPYPPTPRKPGQYRKSSPHPDVYKIAFRKQILIVFRSKT